MGTTNDRASSVSRSDGAKPPSGPISTASGPGAIARSAAMGSRVAAPSSQKISLRAGSHVCEDRLELARLGHLGDAQDAALLGRLDGVGAHAVEVDARDVGSLRQHRSQPGCAHLGRLLHHVVEARMLQRRKQVVQVGAGLLRPDLVRDLESDVAPAAPRDPRLPLAVAPVEDEKAVAVSPASAR